MKDEIFWGNLIGLLKNGKWSLNGQEANAFAQIYEECLIRSRPILIKEKSEPITKSAPVKDKKDANK